MNIVERLREWAKNIRRKPAPLSDAIPMVCEAADRIDALEKQRDELLEAIELYEQALKASWPDGAMGDAFDYWNAARVRSSDRDSKGGAA